MSVPEALKLSRPGADVFVPDGSAVGAALGRATHLAIGAHQDDLEIMAYPAIAECFGRADRSFAGVVVTDGRGSPRAGPFAATSDEEMRRVRRREQREAAVLGRYGVQLQLDHPSAAVKDGDPAVAADLARVVGSCGARTVFLHNPMDKHDTHVAVLRRCLEALRGLPAERRPTRVYGGEVWRDLDWVPDERKVRLACEGPEGLAGRLLAVFASQIAGGKRYDLAVPGRWRAHATFTESHAVDAAPAVALVLDLTALVAEDGPSLEAYVAELVEAFRDDVARRLARTRGR
jgi:LmbE family N-acetylglucosaminyl deacetylase